MTFAHHGEAGSAQRGSKFTSTEPSFDALKNECYHRESFPPRVRARFAVADYIEMFYNRQRLHSSLGYRTPAEALTHHEQRQAA